jgi:beta-galactosidase
VNALAFPYDELSRRPPGTRKSTDIVPGANGSLLIDAVQAGVGGDNSWSDFGQPLPAYRIALQPLSYSFTLSAVAGEGAVAGTKSASATGMD